ncbi:MAG: transposase [bacterium]|nr:transposase [bacterium]
MLNIDEIRALASEISGRRNKAPGRRWRAPDDLRERALEYARECREQGEPVVDIAGRLGMVESTLYRWLRLEDEMGSPELKSVAIIPASSEADSRVIDERPQRVRLITPQGYIVEGLDVDMVVDVLRELG